MEQILTGPRCSATVIDPFSEDNWKTFNDNLNKSGYSDRIIVHRDISRIILPTLNKSFYDVIYIDGAHDMKNVMVDSLYSWTLLKPGGFIIFDDYQWFQDQYPQRLRPQKSIESFLFMFKNRLKIVSSKYQVIIQKDLDFNNKNEYLSYFGTFHFDWHHKTLCHKDQSLSPTQKDLPILEKLIRAFEDNLDINKHSSLEDQAIQFAQGLYQQTFTRQSR
jgi:hypothetical protein